MVINIVRNLDYSILLIIFASLIAYSIFPWFQFHYYGDTASYLSIANHYYNQRWLEAINEYWSPMYSWFISFFMIFGFEPITAAKITNLISATLCLLVVNYILKKYLVSCLLRSLLLFILSFYVFYYAYQWPTPDLLFTVILLFYSQSVIDSTTQKPSRSLVTGGWGALGYLTKSYGLPFFIAHYLLFNTVEFIKKSSDRKNITMRFVFGLTSFIVISGVWVTALSYKYDRFTHGSSGMFNISIAANNFKYSPKNMVLPEDGKIFKGVPSPNAFNFWEDPTSLKYRKKSPWKSYEDAYVILRNIPHNVFKQVKVLGTLCLPFILILLMGSVVSLKRNQFFTGREIFYWLGTAFIYCVGFWFIYQNERYLLFPSIAIVIPSMVVLQNIGQLKVKVLTTAVLLGLSTIFIITPSVKKISNLKDSGQFEAGLANQLLQELGPGQRIVMTDSQNTLATQVIYQWGGQIIGTVEDEDLEDNIQQLIREMKKDGVRYFFLWDGRRVNYPMPSPSMEQVNEKYPVVYDVEKMRDPQ